GLWYRVLAARYGGGERVFVRGREERVFLVEGDCENPQRGLGAYLIWRRINQAQWSRCMLYGGRLVGGMGVEEAVVGVGGGDAGGV
ncbi:hypothetical protein A2U01_0001736, partial [Trifolium medium]|nr:hypothetical protein [Trifolium medium]